MRHNFENHRLRTLFWIVRELDKHPMSLRELNDKWMMDVDLSGGEEIERRTFSNYINAIWDLFRLEIQCERKNNYRYLPSN